MPATISQAYDALLVIFDSHEEQTLKQKLKKIFNENQMIYYFDDRRSGVELSLDIQDKIKNGEIILPESQRIVFCYDIDLVSLDESWMEDYKNRMRDFYNNFTATDASQHYYVTLLRHEAQQMEDEEKEKVVKILNCFYSDLNTFVSNHVEFLMYHNMLENLEKQELGIAQYLYLLTLDEYRRIYEHSKYKGKICLVSYDYYESRNVTRLNEQIKKTEKWLNKQGDSELNNFWNLTGNELISDIVSKYVNGIDMITQKTGMYPVSVKDYRKEGGFCGLGGTYKRNSNAGRAELKQATCEYRKNYLKQIEQSNIKQEWHNKLDEQFAYADYLVLKREWKDCNAGMDRLRGYIDRFATQIEEQSTQQDFQDLFAMWISDYVEKRLSEIDSERQKKKEQLNKLKQKAKMNFANLEDCLGHIEEKTKFKYPAVIGRPEEIEKILIISNLVNSTWDEHKHFVRNINIDDIYELNGVGSLDIQCLKFGSCTIDLLAADVTPEIRLQKLRSLIS